MSFISFGLKIVGALPKPLVPRGIVSLGSITHSRSATKKAGGSTKNGRDSAGRHLGAKKIDGQRVEIGHIIFRQRGTRIYPGENVGMGRDHTLYALAPGYVKYYRSLTKYNKERRYVGVTYEPNTRLPLDPNLPRQRRFDLVDTNAFWTELEAKQEEYRQRNSQPAA